MDPPALVLRGPTWVPHRPLILLIRNPRPRDWGGMLPRFHSESAARIQNRQTPDLPLPPYLPPGLLKPLVWGRIGPIASGHKAGSGNHSCAERGQ